MKKIAVCLLAAMPVSAFAGGSFSIHIGPGTAPGGGAKLFSAHGTHICWSNAGIGHKCEVEGSDFIDANDAYFRLKRQDCCPYTLLKGTSTDFKFNVRIKDL
jgi:hypothetical protein